MPLIDDLDKRREIAGRHRENSGRLAQSYAEFDTTGTGTFEYDERINFGILFVQKPWPNHMCAVDMNELEDLLGEDPTLPQVTAFVTEWDTDEHGMYSGCWIGVRVDFAITAMIDPSIAVTLTHHFTFAGAALKDVTPELSI